MNFMPYLQCLRSQSAGYELYLDKVQAIFQDKTVILQRLNELR
jgi:hypothetical protein